ncbi:MAG: hypothetical protein JJT81_19730 [Rubellimicrobium sp.]|nr:hypothetical protein [Rubellimicrobium sp.]
MTFRLRVFPAAGLLLFAAACMQDSSPVSAPSGLTMVQVDGTGYPVRLTRNETYLMAVAGEGLVPDGRRGAGIRVGGEVDGLMAAHVLAAFCADVSDYRTAAADPAGLYGSYGDISWRDDRTREWVFPMQDCRG